MGMPQSEHQPWTGAIVGNADDHLVGGALLFRSGRDGSRLAAPLVTDGRPAVKPMPRFVTAVLVELARTRLSSWRRAKPRDGKP
jgi:hypothetical protein